LEEYDSAAFHEFETAVAQVDVAPASTSGKGAVEIRTGGKGEAQRELALEEPRFLEVRMACWIAAELQRKRISGRRPGRGAPVEEVEIGWEISATRCPLEQLIARAKGQVARAAP